MSKQIMGELNYQMTKGTRTFRGARKISSRSHEEIEVPKHPYLLNFHSLPIVSAANYPDCLDAVVTIKTQFKRHQYYPPNGVYGGFNNDNPLWKRRTKLLCKHVRRAMKRMGKNKVVIKDRAVALCSSRIGHTAAFITEFWIVSEPASR